jgi:predicted permease
VQHRLAQTLAKLESIPGVVSAAIALNPPASGANYNLEIHIAGRDSRAPGEKLLANAPAVSASYFRTLGIPLLAGKACRDNIDTPNFQQAMINRQFADRYFPNESPIGHTLEAGEGSKTSRTVIAGVVGDARDTSRTQLPGPTIYWCTAPGFWPDPIYLVKTQGSPAAFANTLRQQIKQFEPGRAVYGIAPLEDQISSSAGEQRLQTMLLSLFGLTALLLASIGLYGVLGFFVSQRTREIGLRMAIGAAPGQVFRQVFRHGASMTIGGVIAGVVSGFGLSRLASSLLFGVKQWDPLTFVAAPTLLLAVAALAIGVPSRRATLVDPIEALREE